MPELNSSAPCPAAAPTAVTSARGFGAHVTPAGLEVNVFAAHASALELCILTPDEGCASGWAEDRIAMSGPVHGVWHVVVPGAGAGTHYGLRAHGTWDLEAGLRHNPNKLLVDPYARGIVGEMTYGPASVGYKSPTGPGALGAEHITEMSEIDSLGAVPISVVVDSTFRPPEEARPRTPWADTVIYEAHVRGLTQNLPGVPDELRGTYAGLAHPVTIAYLKDLGVTAIELLPIHASVSEPHLAARDMINYWGYNTLGFFAPHADYAMASSREAGAGAVLDEVKGMVTLLHEAGLEVLLDVVYNHTCEGGADGLHVSWRGLDNTSYYLHDGGSPARLADVTGTGNTLDFRRNRVIQLALDSLRYWATEVGIDGFRFDLAVTLGRGHDGFSPDHPFLVGLATDPVLSSLKLIAEPWDMGPGGWRTGQFPAPFAEWNDHFRGAARQFWLSDPAGATHGHPGHGVRDLATRLAGSVDLFGFSDPMLSRGPGASINFVTAHDGFTMGDLTAYEHKHNAANGEDNRDGTNDNRAWNHGIEGNDHVDDYGQEINALRRRSHRNLLATMLFAAGTPMITAGDEFGRSQSGNNNPYCQDNEISWVDWDLSGHQRDLLATTTYLLGLRSAHPGLRPTQFYRGKPYPDLPEGGVDLAWYTDHGVPLTDSEWHDPAVKTLQMVRNCPTPGGSPVMVMLNGSLDQVEVTLAETHTHSWELVWDSTWEHPGDRDEFGGIWRDGTWSGNGVGTGAPRAPGGITSIEPLSTRLYVAIG